MNEQLTKAEDMSPLGQAKQRMRTIDRMLKSVVDTLHVLNQERMKLALCLEAAKLKEQEIKENLP